jgi:WD40 repeat protein
LIIWDLKSGHIYKILEGYHASTILDIGISTDSRQAITSSADKTLRVWDLESLKFIGEMIGHIGEVESVSIAPDNRSCISRGRGDGMVILWDLRTMQIIKRLPAYSRTDQADFLLDGRSTITRGVSMGYSAMIHDIRHEKSVLLKGFDTVAKGIPSCDNQYILGWNGGQTKIYDLQSGINITQLILAGDEFRSCGVAWPQLVFGRSSGQVSFYSLENLELGPAVITPARLWVFAPLGQQGHWHDNVTSLCRWCGRRFSTPSKILDVIDGISRSAKLTQEQSPCLHLPDEAWEEPKLISDCPLCKNPLQYNPFKVDNSEGL